MLHLKTVINTISTTGYIDKNVATYMYYGGIIFFEFARNSVSILILLLFLEFLTYHETLNWFAKKPCLVKLEICWANTACRIDLIILIN